MRLSDLKTGDEAFIIKVKGHGGFRKRIVEMGFIKGQRVDVLQSAPLQDPVKYKVMGYEVSLRRQEAEQIEVSQDERDVAGISEPHNVASTAHYAKHSARHTIKKTVDRQRSGGSNPSLSANFFIFPLPS